MPGPIYETVKLKFYEPGYQSGTISICHPKNYYEALIPVRATADQLFPVVKDSPELNALSEEYGYIAPYGEAEPVLELDSFVIKMDDAQAAAEKIRAMLGDLVTGPMSQHFVGTGPTRLYRIQALLEIPVTAASPGEAIKKLLGMYPQASNDAIQDISEGNRPMAYAQNDAGDDIWFRPSCPIGETDCMYDPMREKAEKCASQAEADALEMEPCCNYDPDDEYCDYYQEA